MAIQRKGILSITDTISGDFRRLWIGQTISNLGSSFTSFAIPLIVFRLTGSALNLSLTSIASSLPGLLFGLIIGAWVDRVDRKKLMVLADLSRAICIATIPLLVFRNWLPLWWIYMVCFVNTTLAICFGFAQVTAIPHLVKKDDLVTANGQITASFTTVDVIGPLLAGLLVAAIPPSSLLLFDAISFLISAVLLTRIRTSFNATSLREPTQLHFDIVEGLRYVLYHPVFRSVALIAASVNFVVITISAQMVLFVKGWLQASDFQLGFFYAAESIGVICFSLAVGTIRKHLRFSSVALGAIMLHGLLTIGLALLRSFWAAAFFAAVTSGLMMVFNLNIISLRQAIVPNALLGRVTSVLNVIAGSVIPLGTLLGGVVIDRTQNVALVFGIIGGLLLLIGVAFVFTPLGNAEQYISQAETTQ